jgi:hypothetical protein
MSYSERRSTRPSGMIGAGGRTGYGLGQTGTFGGITKTAKPMRMLARAVFASEHARMAMFGVGGPGSYHQHSVATMIGQVLTFFRQHLDDQLRAALGEAPDEPSGDRVVFVDGDKFEPITFKLGAVSELLINVEEERVLRDPDLYARQTEDGTQQRHQPDVRLILYLLFVARFKQYESAWEHLSKIIEHFQTMRVLDHDTVRGLPVGIEKLIVELVTLGFAEQNEVWNALRTTHHPSILYRVRMIVMRDRQPQLQTLVGKPSTIKVRSMP